MHRWEYVSELTTPRGGVGVATVMGRVFAVGGHNGNIYLNTVEAFEPRMNRWGDGWGPWDQCRVQKKYALILSWLIFAFRSDGSWWAQCLTAALELGWPSARLMSARSGTSARAPATWPTACEHAPVKYQVTDCQDTFTIWSLHKHTTQCTQTVKEWFHPATFLLSPPADVQFAHSDTNIREVLLTWTAHLTNLKSSLTKCHV